MATSALNYISDTVGEKSLRSRMGMGLLSGIAGAAFSPYEFLRNPRRGCGSPSPFIPSPGYSSVRGYQYELPKSGNGSQSQTKKFSLKDFLREVAIGGVTGGLSSAAFYGAGKGIERLKDGLRPSKGSNGPRNILNVGAGDNPIPCATNIDINPNTTGVIYGNVNDLSQFDSGQFDHVIALNPYNYYLLDSDVPRVLKDGGIMSVTGNYSNKYFKGIYSATAETVNQAGFEIVSKGNASSIFTKYGGKVTGGTRQTQGIPLQIILKKVG